MLLLWCTHTAAAAVVCIQYRRVRAWPTHTLHAHSPSQHQVPSDMCVVLTACLCACADVASHFQVTGCLKMRTYLSGMPECKLGLNDKVGLYRRRCLDVTNISHSCVCMCGFPTYSWDVISTCTWGCVRCHPRPSHRHLLLVPPLVAMSSNAMLTACPPVDNASPCAPGLPSPLPPHPPPTPHRRPMYTHTGVV